MTQVLQCLTCTLVQLENGTQVEKEVMIPYDDWSEANFTDRNISTSNRYWEGIFPGTVHRSMMMDEANMTKDGDGLVALSDDWRTSLGLPISIKAKENPNYSVYFMAGFHQLHCLVSLQRASEFG